MSWQILIILSMVAMSVATLFFRAVARQKQAHKATFAVGAVQSLVLLAGILVLIPVLGDFQPEKIGPYFWWFVGGGLASALGNACAYKIFAYLEAGLSNIFTTLNVVFVVIFGTVILHEYLNTQEIIGSLILFSAVIYGALLARHPEIKKRDKSAWLVGIGFGILAGVLSGGAITNIKFLIDNMSATTVLVYIFAFQTLFTLLIALITQRDKFKFAISKPVLKFNISNGLLRAAGGALAILAIAKSNNVVLVSIVGAFNLVLIIVLAAIFLKEHQQIHKKLAIGAVATTGLIIIFWQ